MGLLTVGAGGVPVGSYLAQYIGYEPVAPNTDRGFNAGLRWKFKVLSGAQKGQVASRVTGTTASLKNSCGRMLGGLLGRALQAGEAIDPDQFIGKTYLIVVAAGPQGGTRIDAVTPNIQPG